MVGNYARMSIILLNFIDIIGLARAAPSRQVPGGSAKPRAFSGLRESLQVHSKGECASDCRSKNERFSGPEWFTSGLRLAAGEDDRLVAGQLGEMLRSNVAKLAQEKTFARSEGVVIQ